MTFAKLSLVIIVIGLYSVTGQGQCATKQNQKSAWTSPSGRFQLIVPFPPTEPSEDPSSNESVSIYGGRHGHCGYLIAVVRPANNDSSKSTPQELARWKYLLIGETPHEYTEKPARVDGLPAIEIVDNVRVSRGFVIEDGNQTYVVGYFGDKPEDLRKKEGKKFLASFKLTK